jgi:hypothetical protein
LIERTKVDSPTLKAKKTVELCAQVVENKPFDVIAFCGEKGASLSELV